VALGGASVWLALAFVGLVHAAGGQLGTVAAACVLVAAPLAFAGALRSAVSYWRGPDLVSFTRADAEGCSPAEAAFVRGIAQLRGTMGGAGFLYPRRLALPIISWVSAAAAGATTLNEVLDETVGAWPVAITLVTGFVAFLLPARPYFYRETTGGEVIVCPPPAAQRLKYRARREAERAGGAQGVPAAAEHAHAGRRSIVEDMVRAGAQGDAAGAHGARDARAPSNEASDSVPAAGAAPPGGARPRGSPGEAP
jgi:hypothetical protein